MSSATIEEYIGWLNIDRELLSKKDAAVAEIARKCSWKFLELHPVGDGSTSKIKEETGEHISAAYTLLTQAVWDAFESSSNQISAANAPAAGGSTKFRGENQIAAMPWREYDRPINDGQSENARVQLKPVFAWWLRGGAWASERVVEMSDPRQYRFEDRKAYYHAGGPYNPKDDESEFGKQSAVPDDQELTRPGSVDRARRQPALHEAPRGRRRER